MERRPDRVIPALIDEVDLCQRPVEASFSADSPSLPPGLRVGEEPPDGLLLRCGRDRLQLRHSRGQ